MFKYIVIICLAATLAFATFSMRTEYLPKLLIKRERTLKPVCVLYYKNSDGIITNIPPQTLYLNSDNPSTKLVVVVDREAFLRDDIRIVYINQ